MEASLLLPRQHRGILCCASVFVLLVLPCAWRGTLTSFATSEICRRRPPANANDGRSAHTAICLLRSDRFAGQAHTA